MTVARRAAPRSAFQHTLLPLLAALAIVALEWPFLSPIPAVADHFQFWAAGNMVVSGVSPYDRTAWEGMAAYPIDGIAANTVPLNLAHTSAVWLYPPQTAFIFVPFGALPPTVGIPLLHVAVLAAALAGVLLATEVLGLTGRTRAVVLLLAAISEPFVIVVRNGHPIGLVLAGLALAALGARERRMWELALGVILISLKPHIALAFGVGAVAYVIARKDVRAAVVGGGALAAVTAGAWIVDPFPLSALTASTAQRLTLDLSTTAALSRDLGGGLVVTLALAVLAIGASAYACWTAREDRRGAVGFASLAALSLVVAPYVHDYDLLLALPAALLPLVLVGPRIGAAWSAIAVVVLPWLLFYWWPLLGMPDRPYQGGALGALPILALLGVAALASRSRRLGAVA